MKGQRVKEDFVMNVLVQGILASINHGGYGYSGVKTLEQIYEDLMTLNEQLTIPILIEQYGLSYEDVHSLAVDVGETFLLEMDFIFDLLDPPHGEEPKSLRKIAEIIARAVNK